MEFKVIIAQTKKYELVSIILFGLISLISEDLGIFLFGFISILFMSLLNKKGKIEEDSYKYFIISYLIYLVFAIIIYYAQLYIYGSPFFEGANDDLYYYERIIKLVENYNINYFFNPNDPAVADYSLGSFNIYQTGYEFIIGTIGVVFNLISPNSGIFYYIINSFFGAITILLIYKIILEATNNTNIAQFSTLFAMIYPHMIFYSGTLLKDVLVTLIIAILTYLFVFKRKKYSTLINTILGFIFFYFLMTLRFRIAIVVFMLIIICSIAPKYKKINLKIIKNKPIYIYILFVIGLVFVAVSGMLEKIIDYVINAKQYYFNKISSLNGLTTLVLEFPPIIINIVVFCIIFIMPFSFWSSFSSPIGTLIRNIFMDIGTLYWLLLLPFAFIGIIENYKNENYNNGLFIFVIGLVGAMSMALTMQIRWRLMILPYYSALIGIGFYHKKEYLILLRLAYLGLVGLAILYALLKILI